LIKSYFKCIDIIGKEIPWKIIKYNPFCKYFGG